MDIGLHIYQIGLDLMKNIYNEKRINMYKMLPSIEVLLPIASLVGLITVDKNSPNPFSLSLHPIKLSLLDSNSY